MTEEAKPTMMDAVNAALDPVTEKPAELPETEKPEVETPEIETPVEGADGGADPAKAAPDGGADPAKAAPEGETPEQKTAREAVEAAAKKPLDPVNDPIPPTVAPRTKERIVALIDKVKALTTAETQRDELVDTITSTGVSAENFAQTLTFLRLFNSDNIEDKRRAYDFMLKELQALAPHVGEVLPGADPLAGHQDLLDAVAAHSITQKYAEEIALSRSRAGARTAATEQQTATQREAAAYETARLSGVDELNQLEVTLRTADPAAYDAKRPALIAALGPFMVELHPSKWKAAFEKAFKAMPMPAAAAAPVVPAAKPGNGQQPMRANKAPAGDGQKQVTTMLGAVNAAVDSFK